MTPVEYLESIKERLFTDPVVARFQILRERITAVDVHVRARLSLIDDSQLEFSEYAQYSSNAVNVITYSYHWSDSNGKFIQRWDNAPHFPGLAGFPHHIHQDAEENVRPGHTMSIFKVLDEIAHRLNA